MSMPVAGLGEALGECLRQAHMTAAGLAICITMSPHGFASPRFSDPNGQTDLAGMIRQIISKDEWALDGDSLAEFIGCCCRCLVAAKRRNRHNLALFAAHASFNGFGSGLNATFTPPPDDEVDDERDT